MKVTRKQLIQMINNNDDVSNVDTSEITDMSYIFYNKTFNQDISKWNISNIENLSYMFLISQFNKNIFNLKEKINTKKIYSKHMQFIKNNLVVGEYE